MSSKKNKNTTTIALRTEKADLKTMSFDEINAMDDKERDKLINDGQKREQKRLQLISQIGKLKGDLTNLETKYLKSLMDSAMDTIQIRIEINCKEEESKIASEVYAYLFPEVKNNSGAMCVVENA